MNKKGCLTWYTSTKKKKKKDFLYDVYFCQCLLRCVCEDFLHDVLMSIYLSRFPYMGPKDQIKVIKKKKKKKKRGCLTWYTSIYKKKQKKNKQTNNAICEDFLHDVYFCQCLLRCLLLSCL